MRSSPARVMSIEVGVTVKPIEGWYLEVWVGGSWFRVPESGLESSRVFGAGLSETQQTKPPEEADGVNPDGGTKGNVRRYHVSS